MATPEPHLHAVLSAGGLHWVMLQLSLISEPLWARGSLSKKIGFTATNAKENQFIFVLIYRLICKKIPARWFYILLLVLIVWIKHFHFSIICHTWNFLWPILEMESSRCLKIMVPAVLEGIIASQLNQTDCGMAGVPAAQCSPPKATLESAPLVYNCVLFPFNYRKEVCIGKRWLSRNPAPWFDSAHARSSLDSLQFWAAC